MCITKASACMRVWNSKVCCSRAHMLSAGISCPGGFLWCCPSLCSFAFGQLGGFFSVFCISYHTTGVKKSHWMMPNSCHQTPAVFTPRAHWTSAHWSYHGCMGCKQQEFGSRTALVVGLSPDVGQHGAPAHVQAGCVTAVPLARAHAAAMDPGVFAGPRPR